jgi:GR25 family glycosyltransferase involved in LPS biosynthesis
MSYTQKRPSIDDIWIINLEKDVERFEHCMKMAPRLPKTPNRWVGTNGREEDRLSASVDGVSPLLTESTKEESKKTNKILHSPGVIGCWLSHKRLLRHLQPLRVPNSYGHLIMEDDVNIPVDFQDQWNILRTRIPCDWDMVYLYTGGTYGEKIHNRILRWKNDKHTSANWGTVAYIVRHGAIPYILSNLQFMDSPIDNQFYRHLGKLNIYIVDPPLITTDGFESTIVTMNKNVH